MLSKEEYTVAKCQNCGHKEIAHISQLGRNLSTVCPICNKRGTYTKVV